MADERKFRFVSPGIFITELDRSQIPAAPDLVGPVIVGRAKRGPGMTPTRVSSFSEFINVFGETVPGGNQPGDVWRYGGLNAPMYGTYAAQAHLQAGATPLTYVRLLGVENQNATTDTFGEAGFRVETNATNTSAADTAGAFGIFLFGSGSATAATGTLAAVIYASGTAPYLSGAVWGGEGDQAGMNALYDLGADPEFDLYFSETDVYRVSLRDGDSNYIREVINTNPQLLVTDAHRGPAASVEPTTSQKNYWLGETYERTIKEDVIDPFSTVGYFAAIIPLNNGGTAGVADRRSGFREAQTPWFISQDLSTNTGSYSPSDRDRAKPLFKFVSLNGQGEDANKDIKVSIANVRYSPNDKVNFGSFDVLIRSANDSDTQPQVLERYSGVSLDPNSANYIAARIGDRYAEFDEDARVLRSYGDYDNRSNLVRVVVSTEVEAGDTPALLPFGYYGVPKFATAIVSSSMTSIADRYVNDGGYDVEKDAAATLILSASSPVTGTLRFPDIPVRLTASDVSSARTDFFGISTVKTAGSTTYNQGYVDYTRFLGQNVIGASAWNDAYGLGAAGTGLVYEDGFSLDDVEVVTGSVYDFSASPLRNIDRAVFTSGSRAAGTAFNCSASESTLPGTTSYKNILDAGFNKFTAPMFGGFDGLDITQRDPLRNRLMSVGSTPTVETNYVLNTYRTALDILADTEQYEFNLMSVPGVWYSGVTNRVLEVCEQRGDALGVIDLEGGYLPPHEIYYASKASRKGTVQAVVDALDSRNLDNSYGATYYPWVLINDTISGVPLRVPPSVPAVGVLANTERVADVWFAPAGFNRGGLSTGQSGLQVVNVDEVLNSADRDRLYSRNVNPIARFPAEGIVIFGQKTLQATPSALDRINVRRLLIFLKRGISQIAAGTLFEQNVQSTWSRFKGSADSFLSSVQIRFGLDDFRVVLDETTTTPDLIDRNIMYAKVFIKPTRSIEFIALDFIITRSGASFDD
jgi:hypothetical protein